VAGKGWWLEKAAGWKKLLARKSWWLEKASGWKKLLADKKVAGQHTLTTVAPPPNRLQ